MRIPDPSIAPAWRRHTARLAVSAVILGLMASVMPASAEDTCDVTVTPADIIQNAINNAADDDVICLGAGTFTEEVRVTRPVTLRGVGDGDTVLDVNGGAAGFEILANDVTIADLRVEDYASYGIEVNTATISNLRIEGVTVTGGSVGFKVATQAVITGLTVVDSHFDGNTFGWYLAHLTGTTVTDVDVSSSTFSNNELKGLYIEKIENAVFDGITVADSGTDPDYMFNEGISLNLKAGNYADIEIRNTTVTGSGLNGGTGISVSARDDSVSGTTVDGVTLSNVSVSGGATGVRFGEPGKDNPGPTNVVVTGSSLSGTSGVALANKMLAAVGVNASGNWWGSVTGPTGAMTDGAVTTAPWCVDAACSALSDDAGLTSLSLSAGTLSPAFSPSRTTYAATVGNGVTAVTVSRTAHPGATTTVSGGSTLAIGANAITVEVTSVGGATRTYTITVTRAAPTPPPPAPEPTPSPSPSPSPMPSPLPGEPVRTISEEIPAGGRVTSDPDGEGPSPEAPVQIALTSPVAGTVTIDESVATGVSEGWELVGRVLDITAPPATPEDPIVLDLAVDATILEDDAPVAVFRDGVRVPACDDPAATVASPDPCVARRTALGGATSLTVRTSRASVWTIGVVDSSTPELACPAGDTPRAGFVDVPDDATHRSAIDCVTWRGIVHGTAAGRFDPGTPVTRGQMASFLARLLTDVGVDLPTAARSPFADAQGGVHGEAIAQLAELGVVTGTTATTFEPAASVSRGQSAALLVRAHELALGREAREAEAAGFEDVPEDGTHAAAIRKVVRLGFSTGVTGATFEPSAATTRSQAASFLSRLLTRLVAEGLTL